MTNMAKLLNTCMLLSALCLLLVTGLLSGVSAQQCLDAAFLSTHGIQPSPRASSAVPIPPIRLQRSGWLGAYITTQIGDILLREAMGYATIIRDRGDSADAFEALATGEADIDFEFWVGSYSPDVNAFYTEQTGMLTSGGLLGVIGQSGWYVPKWMADQLPQDEPDFWRSYAYNRQLLNMFPRSGITPPALQQGAGREFAPPYCIAATSPPGCPAGGSDPAYLNFQCNITAYSPYCIEMYGVTAYYDIGYLNAQIKQNRLNITVPFLGETLFNPTVADRVRRGLPTLFYYW
jgi:hypothetical protein